MWRDVLLWKENIREFMKRIRQRPVRSGGSGRMDRTMWVVRSDEDGDGRMKMGTNPDNCLHCALWPLTIMYLGDSTNVLHNMLVTYP